MFERTNTLQILSFFILLLGCWYGGWHYVLEDKEFRKRFADWLRRPKVWEGYCATLERGLEILERFFGKARRLGEDEEPKHIGQIFLEKKWQT